MIERLYLRELVTFDEVELEFDPGLVVFTGPSGAGKSVLISSILSSVGHKTSQTASLCEMSCQKPSDFTTELYDLDDEEELIIKTLKKEKTRFYLNNQNISKKVLQELFSPYVKYLSVRDKSGLDPVTLLGMLDTMLLSTNKSFKKLHKEYQKRFSVYQEKAETLAKIRDDESKLAELIEFTTYEIEKIEKINPKVGEEIELMQTKKQLSHIDKLKASLESASQIFDYESDVEEVYRLLDKEGSSFTEMMNQLRYDFEEIETLADELEEIDVEEVLDRLTDITALQNRYGSIEEALHYKEEKKRELQGYRNIEQDKSMLITFLEMEQVELHNLASRLSKFRRETAKEVESNIAPYLQTLKLPELQFNFLQKSLDLSGLDQVDVTLSQISTGRLSGGEFNRLRLALMASTIEEGNSGGVLILDEIDANVSGDESIAIAQMITTLSANYQIFAISHQPHLSSLANQHILVKKSGEASTAVVLDENERIDEVTRIIAGEIATPEAKNFAEKLVKTPR
ncbi:MAG TPA: DNA recombination protein RecN [Epsilonproteobacteria bacterium]|nr:DNA recombination protein RecN [Campylobacterota bacterium]